MVKNQSEMEKILKSLPYKQDKDGNPSIKRDFVRNSGYFEGSGLEVHERHFKDRYPKTRAIEYNQFNNLYNTGFFDDYFARQYKTLKDLYGFKPENFGKPVAVILDDSGNRTGYINATFIGTNIKDYMPKEISLGGYLDNYSEWDEKSMAEKLARVSSLQDLISRDKLNDYIARKGVKRLAKGEARLKQYLVTKQVHENRLEELTKIREKLNKIVTDMNSGGLNHNNITMENVIVYWNNNKEVEIGLANPLNDMDAKHSFLTSDKHKTNSISRALKRAESKEKFYIKRYYDLCKQIYPDFR